MDHINNYHKELFEMWPMLFFCDTLVEKLEHIKETTAYIICKYMANNFWQPIMKNRCIELSQFYLYVNALQQRALGVPNVYKELF
mgnify:FL=1